MPAAGTDEATYPRSIGVLGGLRHSEPLLRRLLHALPGGIQVCVYLTDPKAISADLREAVHVAVSPADLTARSQVVFAMPDDAASLESRVHGPTGVQAGVHSPTTLVISSIVPPDSLRDLAVVLHARTAGLLRIVDAPVLGPPQAIAMGRYSMIIGAAPSVYRAVRPVLELLGPCTRIGGIGTAQIAKACEQFVLAATTLAAIEAIAISQRAGIDLRTVPGWSLVASEEDPSRQIWSAPFESAGPPAGSLRAALEVVSSEAARGPATAATLIRVGELLSVLMDGGLGTADLHQAGRHLIELEHRSSDDHLEPDPTIQP